MNERVERHLSRRERQLMDVLWARGAATAKEVLAALPDPPSYSAVRALLKILEEKGHVRHRRDGARFVYVPTRAREVVARGAVQRLLRTFFGGSTEKAIAALLDASDAELTSEELDRVERLIDAARRKGAGR